MEPHIEGRIQGSLKQKGQKLWADDIEQFHKIAKKSTSKREVDQSYRMNLSENKKSNSMRKTSLY